MALIDQIKARFDPTPRLLEVPEWGNGDGQPARLFFPPITMADREKAKAAAIDADNPEEVALRLLLLTAQTDDGNAAFALGDYSTMRRNVEYMVLQRVMGFMLTGRVVVPTDQDVKDAKELVESDPT